MMKRRKKHLILPNKYLLFKIISFLINVFNLLLNVNHIRSTIALDLFIWGKGERNTTYVVHIRKHISLHYGEARLPD